MQMPFEWRAACRRGEYSQPTVEVPRATGYAVANLVVMPRELALDFFLYAQRNPQPVPILEVTDPGDPILHTVAPGTDVRTDLPRYRVYRRGALVEEPTDIRRWWRDDLMAFILGCSCTVDVALAQRGVPIRSEDEGRGALFKTNIHTRPAGVFHGRLVVSVRPVPAEQVDLVADVTSRYPACHGAPVHIGDPGAIGIADLGRPDWGPPLRLQPGEVPVFHACGVTPQMAAIESGVDLVITHAPNHMLVTDMQAEDLMRL